MPWFKVDDSFYDHAKVFDAPDCVVALWTRAGNWSARKLTNGFVPANLPARLCDDPETAVRELLDRGLWERAKGGYRFHDWLEYQPDAARVEETRAKRAESGKRGGHAKAAKQNSGKVLANCQAKSWQKSAPNPNPNPDASNEASPPQTPPGGFDEFWAAYPLRKAKQAARKAWDKAIHAGADPDQLIQAARVYNQQQQARNLAYTKHPATWLNQGCWDDEPDPRQEFRSDTDRFIEQFLGQQGPQLRAVEGGAG